MKKLLVSSDGYHSNPEKVGKIISQLLDKANGHTLVINSEKIKTTYIDESIDLNYEIYLLVNEKLSTNKKIFGEFSKLEISSNSIILVDLTGVYGENIKPSIEKLKREVLMLDQKIVAIGIICDELEIPIMLDIMLNTFRISPIYLHEKDLNKRMKIVRRKAFILKYFGRYRIFTLLKKTYLKIKHVIKRQ